MTLLPHQQRVVEEHAARSGEAARLAAFIDANPAFETLAQEEQDRMILQLDAMRLLTSILAQRVAFFKRPAEAAQ